MINNVLSKRLFQKWSKTGSKIKAQRMLKLLSDVQEDWIGRPTTFTQLLTNEEPHPWTSEDIKSFPLNSLISIERTSSKHRTSDKSYDTLDAKPWRDWTFEKN